MANARLTLCLDLSALICSDATGQGGFEGAPAAAPSFSFASYSSPPPCVSPSSLLSFLPSTPQLLPSPPPRGSSSGRISISSGGGPACQSPGENTSRTLVPVADMGVIHKVWLRPGVRRFLTAVQPHVDTALLVRGCCCGKSSSITRSSVDNGSRGRRCSSGSSSSDGGGSCGTSSFRSSSLQSGSSGSVKSSRSSGGGSGGGGYGSSAHGFKGCGCGGYGCGSGELSSSFVSGLLDAALPVLDPDGAFFRGRIFVVGEAAVASTAVPTSTSTSALLPLTSCGSMPSPFTAVGAMAGAPRHLQDLLALVEVLLLPPSPQAAPPGVVVVTTSDRALFGPLADHVIECQPYLKEYAMYDDVLDSLAAAFGFADSAAVAAAATTVTAAAAAATPSRVPGALRALGLSPCRLQPSPVMQALRAQLVMKAARGQQSRARGSPGQATTGTENGLAGAERYHPNQPHHHHYHHHHHRHGGHGGHGGRSPREQHQQTVIGAALLEGERPQKNPPPQSPSSRRNASRQGPRQTLSDRAGMSTSSRSPSKPPASSAAAAALSAACGGGGGGASPRDRRSCTRRSSSPAPPLLPPIPEQPLLEYGASGACSCPSSPSHDGSLAAAVAAAAAAAPGRHRTTSAKTIAVGARGGGVSVQEMAAAATMLRRLQSRSSAPPLAASPPPRSPPPVGAAAVAAATCTATVPAASSLRRLRGNDLGCRPKSFPSALTPPVSRYISGSGGRSTFGAVAAGSAGELAGSSPTGTFSAAANAVRAATSRLLSRLWGSMGSSSRRQRRQRDDIVSGGTAAANMALADVAVTVVAGAAGADACGEVVEAEADCDGFPAGSSLCAAATPIAARHSPSEPARTPTPTSPAPPATDTPLAAAAAPRQQPLSRPSRPSTAVNIAAAEGDASQFITRRDIALASEALQAASRIEGVLAAARSAAAAAVSATTGEDLPVDSAAATVGRRRSAVDTEQVLLCAQPLLARAAAAARSVEHSRLRPLVQEAVRRYLNPRRGPVEAVLQAIMRLAADSGEATAGGWDAAAAEAAAAARCVAAAAPCPAAVGVALPSTEVR